MSDRPNEWGLSDVRPLNYIGLIILLLGKFDWDSLTFDNP